MKFLNTFMANFKVLNISLNFILIFFILAKYLDHFIIFFKRFIFQIMGDIAWDFITFIIL